MTRRDFLVASASVVAANPVLDLAEGFQAPQSSFIGDAVFERLLNMSAKDGWASLPIGELTGKVGLALVGTPYVGNTLELSDKYEICAINLEGLDCVTLFEGALDLARIIKLGLPTREAFLSAVRQTRYRGGRQGSYLSRLHYTSDWIWDNDRRHIVKDLTPSLPGATLALQPVSYMSSHPEQYRQLKANPSLVPGIRAIEATINMRGRYFLPMSQVEGCEHLLRTGDIVGITTNEPGIDMAHTGLCYRSSDGVVHFLDASSLKSKMAVSLEGRLSRSILWSPHNTGIVIARPLEPRP